MMIPCNGINIGLDSSAGDIQFLSHAHSDHTTGLKKKKHLIASQETIDLAGLNAEKISIEHTTLLQAGHVLGARQLLVEEDGKTTVYTGDISLKPGVFGFKAEIPECDRLIIEATYGDPSYVFPDHTEVQEEICRFVKNNDSSNIIIGAYNFGKAQEMIRILNECSITPVITEKAEAICFLYEKYGIRLDRLVVGSDEAEEEMKRRFVAIVPMGKAKRYFAARLEHAFERKTLCAVATGWALHYRFNADAAFPLSDHADFNDLVHYIKQSEAKEVEFFCGNGSRVLSKAKGVLLNS
ncbi:hypothetical protein JXA56_03010 [Candidatus Micrarchaeota archaeon]|nr:hypothetical protein [Candidatus Micrarchaeota archaeon]